MHWRRVLAYVRSILSDLSQGAAMLIHCQRGVRLTSILLFASAALAVSASGQDKPPAKPVAKRANLQQHASAGLAGLHIYSTFGCLGLAEDLYQCKQYDAAKVQQIAGDVVKTSELAVEMLKNARSAQGKAADEIPYEDLIQCYYFLDREARLLAEAAKTGDKESLQRFQQAHEESWAKVKTVLGIEEGKPAPEPEKKPLPEKVQP
jgi:hypothetical protein